jgi:Flp pilus assembly protein TadD
MTSSGSPRLYPAAFSAGVFLYGLCAVAGIAYAVRTEHRLPSLSTSALSQAERHLQRGEVRRAVQQLRMAARIDRADYETTRRLASVLQAAGDASGQIEQFERARDLKPGDPTAHRVLAWAYFNDRRLDEAEVSFARASRLDPRDSEAWVGRANVSLDKDRPAEAEGFAREALKLEARNANACNVLGIALDMQGRRTEAIRAFEEAVKLDPSPVFVQNLERARRPPVPTEAPAP